MKMQKSLNKLSSLDQESKMISNERTILVVLGMIAIIVVGMVWQNVCIRCFNSQIFHPESIRSFIQNFGPWAIIVYVILYTLNTIILIPPIAIMSLSAGFLFGPILGTLALGLGAFFGVSATFFIARYLGGEYVEQRLKNKKMLELKTNLEKNGFFIILPIRLLGFPPWEVVNYVAGLSKIKYKDYIVATMIGIFPAIIIQVIFSDRLGQFNWRDPSLWLAMSAFILLIVGPIFFLKWREKSK